MRSELKFIFWIGLLRSKPTATKGRRWQHTQTVAKRVLISPGCLPPNCPSTDQPSTAGQGRGQVRQSPADQKTGTLQPDTTMKPADQSPPKSNPSRRGEEARRPAASD